MSDAFRSALAESMQQWQTTIASDGHPSISARPLSALAADVLATAEMQAIKSALLDRFVPLGWFKRLHDVGEHNMRLAFLPDSVIEWVLS